jgi:hypothetical protein
VHEGELQVPPEPARHEAAGGPHEGAATVLGAVGRSVEVAGHGGRA